MVLCDCTTGASTSDLEALIGTSEFIGIFLIPLSNSPWNTCALIIHSEVFGKQGHLF